MKEKLNVSPLDRLQLIMFCEILEKVGHSEEFDPAFIKSALYGGHDWALEWEYSGILDVEPRDRQAVKEVPDFLDMWDIIERSIEALKPEERKQLKGNLDFPGFDYKESDHASVAKFMVSIPGRFDSWKRRKLDGGIMSLGAQRRMYEVFEPMRQIIPDRWLNVEELQQIADARVHPDYR